VISFVSDAVSPMKKAIFARSRGRKGNYWQNRLKLFPNQALYQAEPQPEMDLSTERASRRGSYFAHFAEEGKELKLNSREV